MVDTRKVAILFIIFFFLTQQQTSGLPLKSKEKNQVDVQPLDLYVMEFGFLHLEAWWNLDDIPMM